MANLCHTRSKTTAKPILAAHDVEKHPRLWVLAGANGAGKSAFQSRYLQGVPFVNADQLAKRFYPEDPEGNSYRAAALAAQLRDTLLGKRRSFSFETVFSHPSKIDFLAQAKSLGFETVLVYIHLELPDLNVARVAQRVAAGGHTVPENKIRERIERTLSNIRVAIPLCDRCDILDNSSADDPFRRIACWQDGKLTVIASPAPSWLDRLAQ